MKPAPLLALLALTLLPAAAAAQSDILWYSFDLGAQTRVVNKYVASKIAPPFGTIVSTNKQAWAEGIFTSALAGSDGPSAYNYVDSGWTGALQGSFTVAWFMKRRTTLPNTLAYYFFSGEGSFRAFTSGAAGTGLNVSGYGSSTFLSLKADIRTPAQSRWVHVALVVDDPKGTATYYVDGVAQPPITMPAKVSVPARANGFRVGAHTRLSTTTFWDMDEFRLVNRAAPAAEVRAWAGVSLAYGNGCGATLAEGGSGGPSLGNAKFGLALTGASSGSFILSLGRSATNLAGLPMPFDLGPFFAPLQGCAWQSSLNIALAGGLDAQGKAAIPLPIPQDSSALGFRLFNQCLVAAPGNIFQTSNGYLFTLVP